MKGKRVFIKSLVSIFLAFLMIVSTTSTSFATIISNRKSDLVSTSASGVVVHFNITEEKIGDSYPDNYLYTCKPQLGVKVSKYSYKNEGDSITNNTYNLFNVRLISNENTDKVPFAIRSIQSPYLNNGEELQIDGFITREREFPGFAIPVDSTQTEFNIDIHYTIARYTYTYLANGGEGNERTFTKYYDVDHVIPSDALSYFHRDGYHLVGFTTNSGGTGTVYQPGDTPEFSTAKNNDHQLYAKWEPNAGQSYTVNVNSNGNGKVSPTALSAGKDPSPDIIAYPDANYEFDKWVLSDGVTFVDGYSETNPTIKILATQDGTATAYFKRIEVDGPTVILKATEDTSGEGYPEGPSYSFYPAILRATYGDQKLPIESGEKIPRGTYDLNFTISGTGATSSAKVYEIRSIKIGDNEPIIPSTPDKTITVSQQEMVNDTTIEVEYRRRSKTITYLANGGTGGPYVDTKFYGVDLEVKDLTSVFAKPKSKFTQYRSNASSATYTAFPIGSLYTDNTSMGGNTNLYVDWVPAANYPVSVNAGDGGVVDFESDETIHIEQNQSAIVQIYEGGTYQKITATPDFDHEFDYWQVDSGDIIFGDRNEASTTIYAEGEGSIRAVYKEHIAEKVTLNVQKSKFATIRVGSTIIDRDGATIVQIEVPKDIPISISASEIEEHYSFVSWASIPFGVADIEDEESDSTIIIVSDNGCTLNCLVTENPYHYIQFKNIEPEKEYKVYEGEYLPQILPIDMPIKAGYTFKGFYETTDGTGSSCYKADGTINKTAYGKKLLTEDLIVYAKWDKISYKVACKHGEGGTTNKTVLTAYIDTPTSATATPSTGYVFDHWDISGPVQFVNESDYTSATTHIYASGNDGTIKAIFKAVDYSLNFEFNGGEYSGTLPEKYTIDESVSLPNNVTKTGTEFVGWYKNPELTDGPYTETQIGWYGDRTLYAGYTDTLKKINFIRSENKKGQKYPGDDYLYAPANVEILINSIPCGDVGYLPAGTYRVTVNITGNNNKSAYQIDGYTVNDISYACQDKIRTISFDLKVDGEENVEINYSIVSYPVTYYQSVEDTSVTHSDYKYYGVDYVPIDCSAYFSKPGFHIDFYQSSKTGGTIYYPDDKAHPFTGNAKLSLYTNWIQNDPESIDVNFYAGDKGEVTVNETTFIPLGEYKTVSISNVESSTIVATPIEGYAFKEWRVEGYAFVEDPNNASTYAYAYAKSSANKITAIYEERTYIITWKNVDDTVLLEQKLHFEDTVRYDGPTPTIDVPGYDTKFSGWRPGVVAVARRDATYTALYKKTPKEYSFILDGNGGTISGQTQFSIKFDRELPPLDSIPKYEGYRFLGFFDDPTEGNQYYNKNGQGVRAWDIPNNATLYAHWTLKGKPVYLTTDFTNTPEEHTGLDYTVALSDNNNNSVSSSDYLFEDNYNEVPQGDYYLKIKLPKYNDKNVFSNPTVTIDDKSIPSSWSASNVWWISSEKITINGEEQVSIIYEWKYNIMTFKKSEYSTVDTVVFKKFQEIPFTLPVDVASLGFSMDDSYFVGYTTPTGETYNLVYDEDSSSYIIDRPYTGNTSKNFWPIWKNKSEYDGDVFYSLEYNIVNENDFYIDKKPENRYEDIVPGEVIKIDNNVQVQGGTFTGWTSEDTSYTNNMYTAFADASFNGSITANKITISYTTNKEDVPFKVSYDGEDISKEGTQVEGGAGRVHKMTIIIDEEYRDQYSISSAIPTSDTVSFRYENGRPPKTYLMFTPTSSSFCEDFNIDIKIKLKHVCTLSFENDEMNLKLGYTELNRISTSEEHTATATITYSSSDKNIATVDDQGYITAHTPGQAIITAHCSDEDSSDATCSINVLEPVFYIPSDYIYFNETKEIKPVVEDIFDTSDFEFELYPKYPNSTNIVFNENYVTTKDDAKSANNNVCQAVCVINGWRSEPVEFSIRIEKPNLKGPSQSTQAFPAKETLAVHYDVTYGNAVEKVIDGIQYPYFSFSSSNSDYIKVSEENVLSATDLIKDDILYSSNITISYHVNPILSYSTSYTAQTARVTYPPRKKDKSMYLGEIRTIKSNPNLKPEDIPNYSFEFSATTSGAARVSINKDTGVLEYYKAAPTTNTVTINIKYKLKGTNSYISQTSRSIELLPLSVLSETSVKRHLFYNEGETTDIYNTSKPKVEGEFLDKMGEIEFTYNLYSDGGNIDLKGSEITARSSGVSQIRVSARLKDKPHCTTTSYFTFTAVCDFGDEDVFKPVSLSASVAGDISAYTWWRIPKDYRQDGTFVKFIYDKKYISGKEVVCRFEDAKVDVVDDHIVFGFPCEIAAKEMSTNITCGYYDQKGNLVSEESTFNLTDDYYAKIPEDSYYSNSLKKLQNYGARAQIHFNFITNNLANKNLTEDDKIISTPEYVYEQTQDKEISISGEGDGIYYYGSSLVTESLMKVKMYFTVDSGTPMPECTINGETVSPVKAGTSGGSTIYYIITDKGDTIKNIGKFSEYVIGNMVIEFSPLSYIHSVVGSSSGKETNRNLVIALFDYYSAISYFE